MKLLSGIIELKPGWTIKLPYPMTEMEMARYRFDPVTMMMVAATAIQAGGQIVAGQAAAEQGEAEAAIAEYNAKRDEQRAAETAEVAARKVTAARERGERLMAAQRAAFAAGGVTQPGTPTTFLEGTMTDVEWEIANILMESGFAQREMLTSAQISRMTGEAKKRKGYAKRTVGYLGAAGTTLTGIGEYKLEKERLTS